MTELPRVTSYTAADIQGLLDTEWPHATTQPELIASGHWSDCFAFESAPTIGNAREYVIRVGRHGEDFRKDKIASQFASPTLPIPQVALLGRLGEDHFAISDRVAGGPLEQSLEWSSLVTPLVELLEALDTADVGDFTGWGPWSSTMECTATSWRGFLLQVNQDPPTSRVHGWRAKLETQPRFFDQFEAGYQQLATMAIGDVPRALVHDDLFHRNAHMVNGRITGVFDWGNSLIGDPLYDLALLCMWEPWWAPRVHAQPVVDQLQTRARNRGAPIADFGARLRTCLLHVGLEHIAYNAFLENWTQLEAVAARTKIVVAHDWVSASAT